MSPGSIYLTILSSSQIFLASLPSASFQTTTLFLILAFSKLLQGLIKATCLVPPVFACMKLLNILTINKQTTVQSKIHKYYTFQNLLRKVPRLLQKVGYDPASSMPNCNKFNSTMPYLSILKSTNVLLVVIKLLLDLVTLLLLVNIINMGLTSELSGVI